MFGVSVDAVPLEQALRGVPGPNQDFLVRLDQAVDTMLANGLAVEIDLHPQESYKQQLRTDNGAVDRLTMLWRQLAAHYATRDPERVFFEIMNEPEVNDPIAGRAFRREWLRPSARLRQVTPSSPLDRITPTLWTCWHASAGRRQRDL